MLLIYYFKIIISLCTGETLWKICQGPINEKISKKQCIFSSLPQNKSKSRRAKKVPLMIFFYQLVTSKFYFPIFVFIQISDTRGEMGISLHKLRIFETLILQSHTSPPHPRDKIFFFYNFELRGKHYPTTKNSVIMENDESLLVSLAVILLQCVVETHYFFCSLILHIMSLGAGLILIDLCK